MDRAFPATRHSAEGAGSTYRSLPARILGSLLSAKPGGQIAAFQHAAHSLVPAPEKSPLYVAGIAVGPNEAVAAHAYRVLEITIAPSHAGAGRTRRGTNAPLLQVGKVEITVHSRQIDDQPRVPGDRLSQRPRDARSAPLQVALPASDRVSASSVPGTDPEAQGRARPFLKETPKETSASEPARSNSPRT